MKISIAYLLVFMNVTCFANIPITSQIFYSCLPKWASECETGKIFYVNPFMCNFEIVHETGSSNKDPLSQKLKNQESYRAIQYIISTYNVSDSSCKINESNESTPIDDENWLNIMKNSAWVFHDTATFHQVAVEFILHANKKNEIKWKESLINSAIQKGWIPFPFTTS